MDADYSQIELRILATHHRRRAHAAGGFERCGHPPLHRRQNLPHPRERGHPPAAFGQQGHQLGIMYGRGAYSLSRDLGIPVKEADTFLKTYLDTFPKVDGYMKGLHRPREGQRLR